MDVVFAFDTWWRIDGTHSAPGWTGLSRAEAHRLGLPPRARDHTRIRVGEGPAAPPPATPSPSAATAAPASSPPLAEGLPRIGPGAGPAGLDATMPEALAAAIVYAWRTQEDPALLRQLATTMLQGGYRVATDVLVARADARQQAQPPKPAKSSGAKAIGLVAAAVGIVAGLASLRGERA